MIGTIFNLILGRGPKLLSSALDAFTRAKTSEERMAAEVEIARMQYLGGRGWALDVLILLVGIPLALHIGAVAFDSAFPAAFPTWVVHKLPAPMDDWEGRIVLSLFGLGAVRSVFGR